MFTGLIEEKGRVVRVAPVNGGAKLSVEAEAVSRDLRVGDSVAVNGVCLTVVEVVPPVATFDAVRETLERSTLGRLKRGDSVNLERSLRLGDRLGGHLVLGHVDAVGTIRIVRSQGAETTIRIEAPAEVMTYVVEKGSIAVDGVSLTVAGLGSGWFELAVIPHTLAATTLSEAVSGSVVNLETDIIGKYVYRYVRGDDSDRALLDKLERGGFL
jgi:riboflavin synthase